MDFVHDQLASGQRIRTLSIIDNFTRECLALEVDTSLPSLRVIRVLDQIAEQRALPQVIRTDNGPEFTSRRFLSWSMEKHVRATTIEPGKPRSEPIHRKLQRTVSRRMLKRELGFRNLNDARSKVQQWRRDYNCVRPHSSLNNRSPEIFRQAWEAVGEFPFKGELKKNSLNEEVSNPENHSSSW